MLRKTLPIAIAGVLAAGITLTGCTSPDTNDGKDTNVTIPSDGGSSTGGDTTEPSTGGDDGGVVIQDPGQTAASESVDVTAIGEGSTLTYPAGTTVAIKTDDPTKWTLLSRDNAVVTAASVPASNAAGYDLGFTVASAGSVEVGLFNGETGQQLTFTVVGS